MNVFCRGFQFSKDIYNRLWLKKFPKVFSFFIFVIKLLVCVRIRIGSVFRKSLDSSVADLDLNPDPDLPDSRVFGPPRSGSGSISHRYGSGSGSGFGSGSGSFYYLAKIVRKTFISTVLWLFLNFYLQKEYAEKLFFGSGSTPKCHGSSTLLDSDPDSAKYLNPDPDSSETLASISTTRPDASLRYVPSIRVISSVINNFVKTFLGLFV